MEFSSHCRPEYYNIIENICKFQPNICTFLRIDITNIWLTFFFVVNILFKIKDNVFVLITSRFNAFF